jgi:hypothetical protein
METRITENDFFVGFRRGLTELFLSFGLLLGAG